MDKKLLLIDGNSLTYRAYYATAYGSRGLLRTSDGTPINAVLTLNKMLEKSFKQYKPTHVLIAFDAGSKTLRHDKLKSYKGGRQKTPQELIDQMPIVKDMISKMKIIHHQIISIEADDIIATLAKKHVSENTEIVILSSDKDLFQLVQKNISIAVPQNGNKPNTRVDIDNFFEIYGYNPDQVKDIKGLVGDPSDNLPGVKGIGQKGAVKLIDKYKNIEGIYENIEEITGSIKEKLIKDKEMAFLCKDVATLMYDVEIPYKLEEMRYEKTVTKEFCEFLEKYELDSLKEYYGVSKKAQKVVKNTQKNTPKKEDEDDQINFDNILFK
ncbi:MAG: hypothetical protein HRT99_00640 [Mycoplasmatales bacterium]|nr:hypothetical protein [Mycoplasmatales bacterium]